MKGLVVKIHRSLTTGDRAKMQTTKLGDLELSRLMLGTCQFGLRYGIANKSGQPDHETVRDILACAFEAGVNCLDTSPGYGTSEEVVGRALAELGIADRMAVVSKIITMATDFSSSKAVYTFLEESVTDSLKRLRLDVLPICLFSREENLCFAEDLLKLKDKGLIRHIGVSISGRPTPESALAIIHSGLAEAVQIPTSILDLRFVRSDVYEEAKRRDVAVFARSIYLQGLVQVPENEILPELAEIVPVRRKLQHLASRAGISLSELAIRYVLSIGGVTCLLVGVDTLEQMHQNLERFSQGPLDSALVRSVSKAVTDLPDKIVMPHKWSRRMPDKTPERG